jgi:hypothetical protein
MAVFQSLGIVAFLIVISSNRARYGFKTSPPSIRISPGMPSGPIDLFLPIAAGRFLIARVSCFHLRDVSLAAEYRSIIGT